MNPPDHVKGSMALRADDGSLLEVKEAEVIDQNGKPLVSPTSTQRAKVNFKANSFGFNLSGWLFPIGVIALAVLAAFSVFSIGAIFIVILAIGILHRITVKFLSLLRS